MVDQIHKRLMDGQAKAILERYVRKEIDTGDAMGLLDLKRRQFFKWVKKYKENPVGFTIEYHRNGKSRGISEALEENILGELRMEKTLIDDPSVPIRFYNYSFIKDQWKRVLSECRVNVTYALSPQAKGKIERPYRWLQDRIVRTCARENIRKIEGAREVLSYEVKRYNGQQIHSTTEEKLRDVQKIKTSDLKSLHL